MLAILRGSKPKRELIGQLFHGSRLASGRASLRGRTTAGRRRTAAAHLKQLEDENRRLKHIIDGQTQAIVANSRSPRREARGGGMARLTATHESRCACRALDLNTATWHWVPCDGLITTHIARHRVYRERVLPRASDLWVEYRLAVGDGLQFKNPPDLKFDQPAFSRTLHEGLLRCSMIKHFAICEEAREVVDQFLRSWCFTAS